MEATAEVKHRLSSLIETRKVSLAPLAAKIGVSQSTLWNFIYGDTKNFSKLQRLATELNISLDWILSGDGVSHGNGKVPANSPGHDGLDGRDGLDGYSLRSLTSTIPILGRPSGAFDAVLMNPHEKIGEIERHPAQKNMKDAFAIYVVGEAMLPRYRPGELVYVAAMKPPAKGQDCIVELANGEGYLREFIAHNGDGALCRTLNPAKEKKWLTADVKALHAVVGRG